MLINHGCLSKTIEGINNLELFNILAKDFRCTKHLNTISTHANYDEKPRFN